ncbi:MAG: flippase-like domain-containing protein [Bacteroidales bacterium]|nr:flippase-like domain-containing protein [Bacteroidales bacterium]
MHDVPFLSRYEKIPFTQLVGTVFVERMADFLMLIVLAIIIISSQFGVFIDFFNTHPEMQENFNNLFSVRNLIIALLVVAVLVIAYFVIRKLLLHKKNEKGNSLIARLKLIKLNLIEGIKTISKLENKWYFVFHTLFIFLMWLLMLYVIFLAFEPTSHLSIYTGMITFLMGGLAMLAPVQGGIGPWHFMVFETLFIYGIDKGDGKIFALIAHASTNLIYLIFGAIALILLPLLNNLRKDLKNKAVHG